MAMTVAARMLYRLAHWLSISVPCTVCQCSSSVSIKPSSCAQFALAVFVIQGAKKLNKLLKIRTHLEDQLAERHLLRAGQPIETPAISPRIVDRLYGRDTQQLRGFFFGQLWRQGVPDDLSCDTAFAVHAIRIAVKLIEDLLQSIRSKPGSLPKLQPRKAQRKDAD